MRQLINMGGATPLLDISSYARRGPARRDRLSAAEIELIGRTANRTPEVMVKVLTRGGQNLKAVRAHLAYLTRGGKLDIETDDGERMSGKKVEKDLLDDWNLDLEEYRRGSRLGPRENRKPPRLAHKILFSMPPGTPPKKVFGAVKNFAREEFALKHRYAMVLHTDEPHPHVHMVVKAMSEQGVRLNIRKATLREWRREFAHHLREQGIPANATERAVRGESMPPRKTDGIYRATLRGESTHYRERVQCAIREQADGNLKHEPGRQRLEETRGKVVRGWNATAGILDAEGRQGLALTVREFVNQMKSTGTERAWLVQQLRTRLRSSAAREDDIWR